MEGSTVDMTHDETDLMILKRTEQSGKTDSTLVSMSRPRWQQNVCGPTLPSVGNF